MEGAELSSLRAEVTRQRTLLTTLLERVSALEAQTVKSMAVPAVAAAPAVGVVPAVFAPLAAPVPAEAGASQKAQNPVAGFTGRLVLANTVSLPPEFYMRELQGVVNARICDSKGDSLILAMLAPDGSPADDSLVDGLVVTAHMERAAGVLPAGAPLVGAADRPLLIQGATAVLQDGKAVFRDMRVTDSTYNLIKKAQALLVFSCHQAGGVTSAVTTPFRVLTKRSQCDKKSGPANAGGSRRPRSEDITAQDAIRALPGLGARSAERLMAAGVSCVGQLATALSEDESEVRRVMGNVGINSKAWLSVLQHTAHLLPAGGAAARAEGDEDEAARQRQRRRVDDEPQHPPQLQPQPQPLLLLAATPAPPQPSLDRSRPLAQAQAAPPALPPLQQQYAPPSAFVPPLMPSQALFSGAALDGSLSAGHSYDPVTFAALAAYFAGSIHGGLDLSQLASLDGTNDRAVRAAAQAGSAGMGSWPANAASLEIALPQAQHLSAATQQGAPVTRLPPAPPPNLGVLVAAGALMGNVNGEYAHLLSNGEAPWRLGASDDAPLALPNYVVDSAELNWAGAVVAHEAKLRHARR